MSVVFIRDFLARKNSIECCLCENRTDNLHHIENHWDANRYLCDNCFKKTKEGKELTVHLLFKMADKYL